MPISDARVAFAATDPLGKRVVCYQSTLDAHRTKHREPFSEDDIIDGIESPDLIARSGHVINSHKERLVYYTENRFDDAPRIMKVVVDHRANPGVLTSAFRTSRFTQDGVIVYRREGYLEEKLDANRGSGHE